MNVLGIETSCDETAVAVYNDQQGLLVNEVYSQIELHRKYGGVVPELASRDHIRKTLPLIQQALKKINLSKNNVNAIAYTKGPGLVGALMVGATLAKSLAFAWQIPCVGVHHMESHLMAIMLEEHPPLFPFIALLVSGGHTLLVDVRGVGDYQLLGESIDDAAGEAFDKTAKLLGLPYPGGPALAELAQAGDPHRFHFPRPMTRRAELNFSFSGLKTHVVNCFKDSDKLPQTRADIARAFEDAVVDTLVIKCQYALKHAGLKNLVVVGGVAANQTLRAQLKTTLSQQGGKVYYPRTEFCTDNAAMVAYNGWLRLSAGEKESWAIQVMPRWPLDAL